MDASRHSMRWGSALRMLALLGGLVLVASTSLGEGRVAEKDMPGPLSEVGFDQNLGRSLPLDASFLDEGGRPVRLGDYFGERPVLLAFVYYECPMLCQLILGGLAKSLNIVSLDAAEDFEIVVISIDPKETPSIAAASKEEMISRYPRLREGASGWHFLTGAEAESRRVADVAGFRYQYVAETDEYAHASGIMVVGPQGEISQYYYGVSYAPKDLRLALVQASEGKVGSLIDQVMLYCFRWDPQLGKYTAITMRIVRVAGAIFSLLLATFLWTMWRFEKRKNLAESTREPRTASS
jgi:protein SCO1/2